MKTVKPLLPKSSLLLLAYFARNYPRQTAMVVGALLLTGFVETLGIGALLPLIGMVAGQGQGAQQNPLGQLIDNTLTSAGLTPSLGTLLAIIVTLIVLKSVIFFYTMRFTGFVAADIARDFQLRLIRALMNAQWSFFSGLSLGVTSNAIAAESQRAGHSYMLAGRALASAIQAGIYLIAAFFVSWKLSALAIVLGTIMAVSMRAVLRMARNSGQSLSDTMDSLLARLNDSLSGAKPLKAMGCEDSFCDQLEKETGLTVAARKKQYESNLLLQIMHEPVITLSLAAGLFFALTYTSLSVSEVLLLAFLFHRLMGYVGQTQSHYQNMIQNESAVWSMERQIAQAEHAAEIRSAGQTPAFERTIDLQNVTLAYDGHKPVLESFSTQIPAKGLTVLFGPSGVGKTTLTDAILGLTSVKNGAILIDGLPLAQTDIRSWRAMTGYVPQDSFLFHDTLRQNLTLGADYDDEAIHQALAQANAEAFVTQLPEGLETIAGERGSRFSGGQRQRLALARALIRKPRLLILDEPTSALDHASELAIMDTLKTLSAHMAIILITHNRGLLDYADHTINLERNPNA